MQYNGSSTSTIVIVDQRSSEVEQLQYLLQENHLNVYICNTSAEAYSFCLQTPPSMVFSEISIQPYDGLELLQKLKKNLTTHDVPFILTSKQAELEEKLKYYQLDIDDYIGKPYHPEETACRIITILQELEAKFRNQCGFHHGGFTGNLEEMTLVDLLQILELGEKSAIIHLKRDHMEGKIYVANGIVVDAQCASFSATDTLDYLLGWLYGTFELQIQNVARSKTIEKLPREIYHTGLKLQHIGKALTKELPALTSIVALNKAVKTNGFSEEEKKLYSTLRRPMSVFEILVSSHLNDIQTLTALKSLIDKEIVQFTDQHLIQSPIPPIEREIVEQVIRARKKNKNIIEAFAAFFKRVKSGKIKGLYLQDHKTAIETMHDMPQNQKHLIYLSRSELMLIRQKLAS